jgi:hypothetical protein
MLPVQTIITRSGLAAVGAGASVGRGFVLVMVTILAHAK